jgi:outer membrane receptor protein involved in Fe transport
LGEVQAGLFNLTDETDWTWPNVLGLEQGAPQLDRYTNPGTNASVSLRWRR